MAPNYIRVTVEVDKDVLIRARDVQSVVDHTTYRLIIADNPYSNSYHEYEVMQDLDDIHKQLESD